MTNWKENNPEMNERIREWMWREGVFPFISKTFMDTACWSDYDDLICNLRRKILNKAGYKIKKYASSDQLRYITANLSEDVQDKLGLEVPKEMEIPLTPKQIKRARKMISGLAQGEAACEGVCVDCLIRTREKKDAIICNSKDRKERAEYLRKALKAQTPELKHAIPLLTQDERGHVEKLTQILSSDCNPTGGGNACANICLDIRKKILPKGKYIFCLLEKGSPERAQVIAALRAVLDGQDALLPPYCGDKLEQDDWDGWSAWMTCKHPLLTCPTETKSHDCDGSNWYCQKIFTDLENRCPCGKYEPEIVRAVMGIVLAKGPKEKEFVEFPIWFTGSGDKRIVIGEDKVCYYYKLPDGRRSDVFKSNKYNSYTLTPPKEKEFEPFLAMEVRQTVGDFGRVYVVVGKNKILVSGKIEHESTRMLIRIKTDPDELHEMLRELSGETDMVAEIKAYVKSQTAKGDCSQQGNVRNAAHVGTLSFIADLERKTKFTEEGKS